MVARERTNEILLNDYDLITKMPRGHRWFASPYGNLATLIRASDQAGPIDTRKEPA
jgi:hypothetical protein